MTVAQLLSSISARELHEWMAFYIVDAEEQAEADERAMESAQSRQTSMPSLG